MAGARVQPRYAYDQSPQWVTLYVNIPGVGQCAEAVNVSFEKNAVRFNVTHTDGKNYALAFTSTPEDIDTERSTFVVKPDQVRIKLRKVKDVHWDDLDGTKKRDQVSHKKLVDSGATTQELLANMYKNADPETRESLRKAAAEGARKREEQAKSAGWA